MSIPDSRTNKEHTILITGRFDAANTARYFAENTQIHCSVSLICIRQNVVANQVSHSTQQARAQNVNLFHSAVFFFSIPYLFSYRISSSCNVRENSRI